ncbi:iron-dicitrate transporter ATP-binding subunit [Clostridium botulinum]|uniref:Ferrichrome transport ATP-binding protein n=1 Tax=Clostridium botulinum (strain Hall / ATCC 3502 / NCTC 13319 / Type A) TaxID=441771 RepID=A5HZN2_CLOBH|nr:ABC transporter ATP-binding protein [Clostridium botulinum]EPS50542.1 ferrichrome ABC transporter ATP-binding protein [Clostridium botulinum CFSAN002369]ABS34508.1 ferrichrome transport ATP-binding protein FhuC [Clostridium botulinum A str. ATCC 19397]ABS37359.1 ferrichrome transport ATP-binding protein FhuC [Clostridium botulinum A str. Hall]AUN09671.1 iron-dicitrate transporter ATP-binding subunit [Clostridium botulinum]AUN20715.1 iron-dicitrate transporter ATP-binding subunit [Clostridiu
MNSITTTNLVIAYEDKLIVDGLNMNIPKGKITTIIGPNGCGKSTVLKTIGRILKPKEGLVYLNGDDIRNLSTKEVAQKMAILPQSPQAQGGLTVGELVSYGRFPHKNGFGKLSPEDKKVIEWALDITKLTELEITMVDNLSGGQRQRVWIAMALAQQTDLILLDEPTTYLDMAYQLEVLELLYNLNRKQSCTIVMVLHDLNLAARFADYMIAIRDGSIIKCGTPKEIMTKEVLKDTFNIDAEIVWGSKTGRPTCISYELIK